MTGPEHSSWPQETSDVAAMYKVELKVVEDSWSLSEDECKAMLLLKENLPGLLRSIDEKATIKKGILSIINTFTCFILNFQ